MKRQYKTMLITKHKLEKAMIKAQDQMKLNELSIRADRFCLFKICLAIVLSSFFQFFITVCIVANTIVLAMDRYEIDSYTNMVLSQINLSCFCVFFVEMVLKIIGLSFTTYIKDRFNLFDCAIVIISTVDTILSYTNISKHNTLINT